LGNKTSISAEAKVSVPFVGETSFTVSTEFSADYNWSKETAEETTVSKQLNIPEQEFIVSPYSRLVVDIQLFKIIIPKEDVLLQAEMYGPLTVPDYPYLSNSNVYLMFEIFNRYFPNTQFNKPDPFIFGLSP
ncbi:ETX/MTX2 family pore-forming toxin, partial [Xenorhabdus littoralis]|uniref:ETX/MTX2 family pore-forming toxin n=1 Tax=Xenorhabdus littoralis TaxID=2582835 RepID=UPI0029E7CE48